MQGVACAARESAPSSGTSNIEHVAILTAAHSNILPNRHSPVLCCAVLCCAVLCRAISGSCKLRQPPSICCAVAVSEQQLCFEAPPKHQQSAQKSQLGCQEKAQFPTNLNPPEQSWHMLLGHGHCFRWLQGWGHRLQCSRQPSTWQT